MARSPDGRTLFPLLEGAVTGTDLQRLRMYSFDPRRGQYPGLETQFRRESPGDAIGDNNRGPASQLKAVHLLDVRTFPPLSPLR
jgi:hypothetical protein